MLTKKKVKFNDDNNIFPRFMLETITYADWWRIILV